MRPFVCGCVSTCESEWVRDSVTLSLEDAIQNYFLSHHFQTSYKSSPSWEEESFLFLVTESKIKVTFGTLSVKHFGYDADFSFVPNQFETAQISCSWREEESYWYGVTGFEAKVNNGTLPKNRCGHNAGYRLCPITLKVHTRDFND